MGLLSFMILVRILHIAEFGKWVLFTTMASLIDMLRFGLSKEALVRYLSATNEQDKRYFLCSSWLISLVMLIVIFIILMVLIILLPESLSRSGYDLFCYWYPLMALVNLPWNYAWSIFQAEINFGKIFWIRFFNLCSFLLIIFASYISFRINIQLVIYIYILTNLFTSLFCIWKGWSGIQHLKYISKKRIKELLNYGRFSMLTRIGSSMLKGADSLIISFSAFCGPAGVAIYAIPLKYVELIEIPLLSFATTAFPKLSKASLENKIEDFKRIFYTYTGSIAYLFMLIAIISFFFRNQFILFLGGNNYRDILPEIAIIMLPFILFGMILPLDRFTGVALDSLNKPEKNFYKVISMTTTNIIGDILAVFGLHYLFPEWRVTTILAFVSLASVIFAIVGLLIGYKFLRKEVDISFRKVFVNGMDLYQEQYIKLKERYLKSNK